MVRREDAMEIRERFNQILSAELEARRKEMVLLRLLVSLAVVVAVASFTLTVLHLRQHAVTS